MARQRVEQVQCDRCKRVELRPVLDIKVDQSFDARLGDKTIKFEDLCPRCWDTLQNLWLELKEWDRSLKQSLLNGPKVGENEAAPVSPAPDYTPPKPHSSGKK